jgi:uncharacterized protein (TIGR03435 family)
VLDEHGFGHHRAGTARTGKSGHGRQQVQKQDSQIAHRRILPRTRHRQRMLTNLEFAMHRDPRKAIANALTRVVGRIVQDRTGLTGNFDLDLQWTDLAALLAPENSRPETPPPPADGPSLFTALQEQLGLKLDSQRGPVDVLVIDHAERPTED